MKKGQKRRVRYHLRVTLTAGHAKEESRALRRILRAARIDEVVFVVPHPEAISPGLGTERECVWMTRILRPMFRRLRREGIAPSINFWWTLSFSHFPERPRDLRSRFRFRWAVGADGARSRAVACPRDRVWRSHTRRLYRAFARLRPASFWLDDDVRMTLRAGIGSPCFCGDCLREFGRHAGRTFTRRALDEAIRADPPNRVRETWMDFQAEIAREIVEGLAGAVHSESPRTRMGAMINFLEGHGAEGRCWASHLEALGEASPYVRPPLGCYGEETAFRLAAGFNGTRLAQAAMPEGAVCAPELENYPHSRFGKSAKLTRAQMGLCQFLGLPEITLALYRYEGRLDLETRGERMWERFLGKCKPWLQAIAGLGVTRGQLRGLSLFFHEDSSRHARGIGEGPLMAGLARRRPWDVALPLLGFATRHGTGDVTAFSGEEIDALAEEELRGVFARGVILDARAAGCLLRRGLGELAGVRRRLPDAPATTEVIADAAFGESVGEPMNVRAEGRAWQFEWARGARPISRARGYDSRVIGHGAVLFENHLGGRVVTFPYDGQSKTANAIASGSFLCRARQAQVRAALEWLGRGPPALFVPRAPSVFPLVAEQDGRWLVAVANFLPDPVEALEFHIGRTPLRIRNVRLLGEDGSWNRCAAALLPKPHGGVVVRTGTSLGYLDVAVFRLEG